MNIALNIERTNSQEGIKTENMYYYVDTAV